MPNSGPTVQNTPTVYRTATVTHRSALTAVDKCIVAAITAADQTGTVGVMANAEHKCCVAPGNVYGSAGVSPIVAVTPTLNKTVDISIATVVGATYYDIFFSTDAAPLWVGRVTEAQRLAGCAITAVGTVGAGGSANKVNVRLVGTGAASTATIFTVNNAYIMPTALACSGYKTAIISVQYSVTDLRGAAPACTLLPFVSKKDTTPSVWYDGTATTMAPGSAINKPMYVTYTVDVNDATNMCILVDAIAGQGAAVTVYVEFI
jgi:hypothetical protein